MPRSKADKPSELLPLNQQWQEYKEHVAGLEHRRYLFRGQNRPWRLRTAFHRTGRADLSRFLTEDIQLLHRHLSARTRHLFNLQIADENGAFFNLIQHHGYPTPLLDWTYSPYVAAFFAYRGISNDNAARADPNNKVRIFLFDQAQWRADWPQPVLLTAARRYLSFLEVIAIENERMIPQQSASTVTNIDDIESYIKTMGDAKRETYLGAIDLQIGDCKQVIRELGYMGVTAGSLFPGLDGACEELRERNFEE
ncbi:MAG TPA: FRG domain-containing protein [Bryobacteraceae bacterium]|nr:FRG domain-containing protein [Bryobacteraceae bacterium]